MDDVNDGARPDLLKLAQVFSRIASVGIGVINALCTEVVELLKVCIPFCSTLKGQSGFHVHKLGETHLKGSSSNSHDNLFFISVLEWLAPLDARASELIASMVATSASLCLLSHTRLRVWPLCADLRASFQPSNISS